MQSYLDHFADKETFGDWGDLKYDWDPCGGAQDWESHGDATSYATTRTITSETPEIVNIEALEKYVSS